MGGISNVGAERVGENNFPVVSVAIFDGSREKIVELFE